MLPAVSTVVVGDQSGRASAAVRRSQACQLRQRASPGVIPGTSRRLGPSRESVDELRRTLPDPVRGCRFRHAGSSLPIPLEPPS